MALDDFFKRQKEVQELKMEADRILFEKQRKKREAKEEFEKKIPDFFNDVIDPAIQTVINRFKGEHLEGIYASIGRRFRAARPTQRISRDFHVDFHRKAVQFNIFVVNDSLRITIDVSTDPNLPELKTVNAIKNYTMEDFTTEALLRVAGTAMEKLETLIEIEKEKNKEKENGVLKL